MVLTIIGIVLLCILALILYILFCPLCYRVRGKFGGEKKYRISIKFTDFLRSTGILFSYDGEKKFYIFLFWGLIRIRPKKKKKDDDEDIAEESGEASEEAPSEGNEETEAQESAKPKEKKKLKDIISENKEGLKVIIDKAIKLLKHVFPKIDYADLDYSTGSPDSTGLLTGVLSILPFVYGRRKSLRPDFQSDEAYLKGKISLSGKVFLFYVIYIIIQLFADKDSGKLIKAIMQNNKK